MALSMSVTWCFVLTEILISTECAPKLGHAMYDPLSMEAAEYNNIDEDFLSNDGPTLSLQDKSLTINTETTLSLLKNHYLNEYATETTTERLRTTYEFEFSPKEIFSKRPKNTIDMSHTWKLVFDPTKRKVRKTTNYEKPRVYKILRRKEECESTKSCDASAYGFDPTTCKIVNDRILCGYDKNIGEPQDYDVKGEQMEYMGNDCITKLDRIECGYVNPPFTAVRRPSDLRANSNNTPQIRNKRNHSFETSTDLETDAMTETTTDTTEFTTEIITTTIITSQRTSSETLATSQRNESETFTTSSIDIDAFTPSSTPSSTTNSSTATETTLAALRRDENKNSTSSTINNNASSNTHSSTSNSTSSIDIDTYTPSRIPSSITSNPSSNITSNPTSNTLNVELNTKSSVPEKNTENIGPMKCVEKDDRIVCYDLE